MPHLTLSFGRGDNSHEASGDLSELCIGLGCFIAWMISAGFCMPTLLGEAQAPFAVLSNDVSGITLMLFLIACTVTLIFVGCTDQLFLRFYVGMRVLVLSLLVGVAGTVLMAFGGLDGIGIVLGSIGAVCAGANTGMLIPLWGTAFAKYEFPTITLNTAAALTLGLIGAIALVNWLPAAISVPVEIILLCVSVFILGRLTPLPYYRRRELPVFHALPVNRARFLLNLGIPTLLFGGALGILGKICTQGAFAIDDVASNLLIGAACIVCLIIFIVDVVVMRDESHWDTLFRYMLPLAGLGMIGIPLFSGTYQLGAIFLLAMAFSILLTLMWVMFSDMSQEFRLSPLLVFSTGSGILMVGVICGSVLIPSPSEWNTMSPVHWTGLAMGAIVLLMLAGALNPRKRDVVKMLAYVQPPIEASQEEHARVENVTTDDSQYEDALDERALHTPSVSPAAPFKIETASSTDSTGTSASEIAPERAAAAAAFAANASLLMGIPFPPSSASASKFAPTQTPEPVTEDQNADDAKPQREKGSFYRRCEEIADHYLLSRRETEVLFLLAKGHKAGFIEEKLCVSRSTAKTHINHIYKKLDIHTQQELLNMVEDRPRPHEQSAEQNAPHPASFHHGF